MYSPERFAAEFELPLQPTRQSGAMAIDSIRAKDITIFFNMVVLLYVFIISQFARAGK